MMIYFQKLVSRENLALLCTIGKNNNTCTLQAESSKFASVLFDQGFHWLELIGTPSDGIYLDLIVPGFVVYYINWFYLSMVECITYLQQRNPGILFWPEFRLKFLEFRKNSIFHFLLSTIELDIWQMSSKTFKFLTKKADDHWLLKKCRSGFKVGKRDELLLKQIVNNVKMLNVK